jgi:hypothetical protein
MGDRAFPIRVRVADLTKVFRWRYGRTRMLPDDDAGLEDLRLMIDHLIQLPNGRHACLMFAEIWAPWIATTELEVEIDNAQRAGRRHAAESLGHELNLTYDERRELRITTIRPNMPAEEFARRRREDRTAAENSRRQKKRKAQQPQAPNTEGLLPRAKAVLEAITSADRWLSIGDLRGKLDWLPCFRDGRSNATSAESLKRSINRILTDLLKAGLIEARNEPTKWGSSGRLVRPMKPHANGLPLAHVAGTPGHAHD